VIEQIDEVDVAIEIRGLVPEVHHHAAQLQVLALRHVGHQTDEPERLLFCLGEGGRLVERRVLQQFNAVLV
jgi:hypothetical protein